MKNYFMPSDDAGKELWLKNFAAKLPRYAAKYSISTAELTDMQQSAVYFTFMLDYHNQHKDFAKKLTEFKNEIRSGVVNIMASVAPVPPTFANTPPVVPSGIFVRAVSIAKRLKDHHNYTVADGTDLDIEVAPKPKKVINVNEVKPDIEIKLVKGGQPQLVWKKNSMDALEIHVDRGDGFYFLDIDVKPNFIDKTLLPDEPAIWRYKAIYKQDNEYTGYWSDVMSVLVAQM